MDVNFKGVISGVSGVSGDAVLIIEVVWKADAESIASAQSAGRGVILTTLSDRAALSAAMSSAGNTLDSGITEALVCYGSSGQTKINEFASAGFVQTITVLYDVTYTPEVRITESRSSGYKVAGGWTAGSTFSRTLNYPTVIFSEFTSNFNPFTNIGVDTPPVVNGEVALGSTSGGAAFLQKIYSPDFTNFHIKAYLRMSSGSNYSNLYINVTKDYINATNIGPGYIALLHTGGSTCRIRGMTGTTTTDLINNSLTYDSLPHILEFKKVGYVLTILIDGVIKATYDTTSDATKYSLFNSILLQGAGVVGYATYISEIGIGVA